MPDVGYSQFALTVFMDHAEALFLLLDAGGANETRARLIVYRSPISTYKLCPLCNIIQADCLSIML